MKKRLWIYPILCLLFGGALMGYFGITQLFNEAKNSFKKMVEEVKDLDVELTEFSKVTNLNTASPSS